MSEINDFPKVDVTPNSYRSKSETDVSAEKEKKVEKVVTGKVITKKKSDIRKFADIFISEDVKNVKNYVFMEVLVPAIKKAVSDIVRDGIDMILYGSGHTKRSSGSASYVSYDKRYSNTHSESRAYDTNRTRTGYSYDDIVIESRGEAEEVVNRMDELIETYGMVSVADLYDLVGKSCQYTDNNYGWTNIRNAEIVRVRNGYWIKLPKALPIK